MLHTNLQGHQPFGSGEEDLFRPLPYMAWRPSWSCEQDRLNKLYFPVPKWLDMKLVSIGPVVSEEKMFENVDTHTHTDDRGLSYWLTTTEPRLR